MIYIKQRQSRSWLTSHGFSLAKKLGERLVARCEGEHCLMVTLTYDRHDYDGARDLYRVQKDERHVRRFIARLSKYLGESLTGRWLAKLEFQRGGWVHWHLVITGLRRIRHDDLTKVWGHGHVWISKAKPDQLRYVCKYVAKGCSVPAWLYLEPIRTVKIVRVSPGFWGDTPETEPDEEDDVELPPGVEIREPPPLQKIHGCYVCIGQLIDRSKDRTVAKDDRGRFADVHMDTFTLAQAAIKQGYKLSGGPHGWLAIDCTWEQLDRLVPPRSRSTRDTERSEEGPGAIDDSRLYLINGTLPPKRRRLPTIDDFGHWLFQFFRDECTA